ncbi:10278_t:CDS:2 [Paraglomus brasilianum]|uniref:10278_t:CDS:1 n=1 Tax=Paraglomus brasilianum TaxID=144538 RepID=A0A9N8WBV8_9GLOM|nr:10278_t:CDS:2 [Paraglomus brasilianum]
MAANLEIQNQLEVLIDSLSSLYSLDNLQPHYFNYWKQKAGLPKDLSDAPECVQNVAKACDLLKIQDVSRLYHVESDYYEWELQQRAFRLRAPSKAHLCKSIIFENTRCPHESIDDPLNSKYYCVIVQYVGAVNTQKLMNYVRSLKNKEISKKNYNFRKSYELTGFENNGVSPIGMRQPIPVILSKSITEIRPSVFYMGGGHVDWKLAMPTDAFIKATNCFIADLS